MNSSSKAPATQSAIYDPVPEGTSTEVYGETSVCGKSDKFPHRIEQEIHQLLTQVPGARFSSLSIHRMADGVCLDGMVHLQSGDADQFTRLALKVAGVNHVLNHLTACPEAADCAEKTAPHK